MEYGGIIELDRSYTTGIQSIDHQHQTLVDLIASLMDSAGKKIKPGDSFDKDIHTTIEYLTFHFRTEEKILELINYPELDEHKNQHDEFLRECSGNIRDFDGGTYSRAYDFTRRLSDWLLTHITTVDEQYALYLRPQEGLRG
jgi:hemerythrin